MGVFQALSVFSAIAATALAAPVAEAETGLVKRAQAVNYNQDYIASGAGVTYSPNQAAGKFSVNYNTNADFVVGLGWNPGDSNPITYSGSFTASGVGLLSVYGWSTSPLVEYYVMETAIGYQKVGTHKGTVTSDGGVYDVYLHQQVNQPSISGTTTFNQYLSIRQTPRTSGTVTIANHFSAWAGFGMSLGSLYYQTVSVESWTGSGSGTITVSKGAAAAAGSGSGTTTPASPAAPVSTPPATGGGSSAGSVPKYGQCGGQGWTGATTCAAGSTCKAANSYYSQCL